MKKIILFVCLFFISIVGVNAEVSIVTTTLNKTNIPAKRVSDVSFSNPPFKNLGSGHLIFSAVTYTSSTGLLPLLGVYVDSGSTGFTCKIGNTTSSTSNNNINSATYSIDCPVNFGSSGLTVIYFDFSATNTNQELITSYNMSFVKELSTSTATSELVSIVNQLYTDMGYGFQRQFTQLDEIYGRIGYGFEQSNEINNKIYEEIKKGSTDLKESVEKVEDSVNNLNDNITSSDVTESQNQASSFFDGFDVTDNGGISSIITSPLVAIEKMVSGTCSPLTTTYKGKTISLPCGNSFWADMPDVQNFLNIVLGGFLCYGILAKLYLLIDRLKNPEDDRVEVMKL